MDERRHVHELDRRGGRDVRLRARRRGEEDEQRAQPLAAGLQRLGADRRDDAAMRRHGRLEPLLELLEVRVEPGRRAQVGEGAQRACPSCSATIPPARSRNETSAKPARSSRAASSSGPGNRRTLAGRYV